MVSPTVPAATPSPGAAGQPQAQMRPASPPQQPAPTPLPDQRPRSLPPARPAVPTAPATADALQGTTDDTYEMDVGVSDYDPDNVDADEEEATDAGTPPVRSASNERQALPSRRLPPPPQLPPNMERTQIPPERLAAECRMNCALATERSVQPGETPRASVATRAGFGAPSTHPSGTREWFCVLGARAGVWRRSCEAEGAADCEEHCRRQEAGRDSTGMEICVLECGTRSLLACADEVGALLSQYRWGAKCEERCGCTHRAISRTSFALWLNADLARTTKQRCADPVAVLCVMCPTTRSPIPPCLLPISASSTPPPFPLGGALPPALRQPAASRQ